MRFLISLARQAHRTDLMSRYARQLVKLSRNDWATPQYADFGEVDARGMRRPAGAWSAAASVPVRHADFRVASDLPHMYRTAGQADPQPTGISAEQVDDFEVAFRALVDIQQLDGAEDIAEKALAQNLDPRVWARQMAFLALNADNLRLLLVLLNYYADGLKQRVLVEPIQRSLPQCPYDFALEVARLARIRQASGIASAMVGFAVPRSSAGGLLVHQLRQEHGSPDLLWSYDLEHAHVLVALIPFADDRGVDEHLARIEQGMRARSDTDLARADVSIYRGTVEGDGRCHGMMPLLTQCNRHG